MKMNHINIETNKINEAVSFYCNLIGFKVGSRPSFDFDGAWLYQDEEPIIYSDKIIVAGNDTPDKGEELNESDLIAFGRPFIANPDYPSRVKNNQKINDFDPSSLFGGDANGYTTYTKFGE